MSPYGYMALRKLNATPLNTSWADIPDNSKGNGLAVSPCLKVRRPASPFSHISGPWRNAILSWPFPR
jgi:hypothetical protein